MLSDNHLSNGLIIFAPCPDVGAVKLSKLWQHTSQSRPLPPPGNPEGGSGHAGISATFPHTSPLTVRVAFRYPVGARPPLSRTSRRAQDRRASTRAFWGALSSRPPTMRPTFPRSFQPAAPTSGALLPCKAVLLTPSYALPSKAPLSCKPARLRPPRHFAKREGAR